MRVSWVLPVLGSVLCAALVGCGGGGVTVEGKLVNGGSPYALGEGEGVSINLSSEDGKSSGAGAANKDGTFTIKGTGDKPIPAGKYKVSVTHYRPADPKKGGPNQPTTKELGETWDVGESGKSFTIDMAKVK